MVSPYTENPANYPAPVTLPDDGDLRNATILNSTLEQVIDRTANLNSRMSPLLARIVANEDLHRVANSHPYADWSRATFTYTTCAWTTSSTDVFFTFPINAFLQHGALLRGASCPIGVPTGHSGLPSGRNERLLIRRRNDDWGAAPETIHFADDSDLGSLLLYEGIHWLGGYFTPEHTIDLAQYSYFVVIHTEYGTNAIGGTRVWCPNVYMRTAGVLVG